MLKSILLSALVRVLVVLPFLPVVAARGADSAIDAELAIKKFQVPPGFKVDLFAAEPQLMNPVSFAFDEQGRVYVVETFRYQTSVYDIRDHMNMFDDDLASRNVDDRVKLMKKYLGDKVNSLAVESEMVRLLEDRAGTGKADQSTVFAEGFNTLLDGVAAGVLARKGKVYFADVPNLWLLQDTNHDGKADVRTSLSYGYGVHFNLTGHDLHGLRFGSDGKLYFSMGDRGLHVTTKEGRLLDYPDMGGVLRCNADGSDLEMFASGLRNPQELAFDDHGNLFTGDNNCDHGDAARLVYVAEGGDSGWRTGNQFSETTPAGVWNAEKLWHLQFPGQAAYILPPVGHIADGPSGLAHYPGTGFPAAYQDHFFLCDFRGASPNSGVHSFAAIPNGATFKMVEQKHFFWNILATDVDFSPDGRMFVSDWVQGWPQSGHGRLYRCYDPETVNSPVVLETRKLIAEGMEKRSLNDLAALLGHADQRVRQAAQFELADRGSTSTRVLETTAATATNQLARLHAIWGLGQISVAKKYSLARVAKLLADPDAEVRSQAAKVLGDARFVAASDALIGLLQDPSPRVQYFSAISLGKLKSPKAVKPILEMLRANADKDVFVRHAGVMGLLGTADLGALVAAGKDNSPAVRMAALLVMRRLQAPEIAMFLHDTEPLIVLETARAINDVPIAGALPQLAALIDHPAKNEPLDWRVVNAAYRLGGEKNAGALAIFAEDAGATDKVRGESLRDLETWANPTPRDRLTGLWRPLAARDGKAATEALRPVISKVLNDPSAPVQVAAIHAATKLGLGEADSTLAALVANTRLRANVRVEALKALEELRAPNLAATVAFAVADGNQNVRTEANRLQAMLKPGEAAASLSAVLEKGGVTEQQGAYSILGRLKDAASDQALAQSLDKLIAGQIPKEVQLDLLLAAKAHSAPAVQDRLKQYQAAQRKDDEFAGFRETLYGGDADAGRKIFMERPEAACTRCHKIDGSGGEVGPELTGIGLRHDREYILESILFPNKQIAAGFESLLVKTKTGEVYAGIVKSEDASELVLNANDDGIFKLVHIKKADLQSRERGQSAMPEGMGVVLSKQDLRNLVEFLATVK